jgi:hypothetical protein
MDSLSFTEIIVGLVVGTIGIQVTLGTIANKVLSSRYATLKELYELQLRFAAERLETCEDDLDDCRERVRRQNGGFVT